MLYKGRDIFFFAQCLEEIPLKQTGSLILTSCRRSSGTGLELLSMASTVFFRVYLELPVTAAKMGVLCSQNSLL